MPLTSSKSHRDVSTASQHAASGVEGLSASGASLTRLEAHAAVRLDPLLGKTFDCYGLPLRRADRHKGGRFSFIKSMKGLASYLTTRINPSFQECLVSVVESESDLRLEVRPISTGKATRTRVLFSASLSTLVDVARDSVIEKDTVVFSKLPSSFQPKEDNTGSSPATSNAAAESRRAAANASSSSASAQQQQQQQQQQSRHRSPSSHHHSGGTASKKEELISTLFSAYGDIGLNLVFHAARPEDERLTRPSNTASSSSAAHGNAGAARPYTRIGLRFVSTAERNEWLAFCGEAYMGLLLDSIRTNRDTVYVSSDGSAATATATAVGTDVVHVEKPSEDVVESYIDFFLSARTKTDGAGNTGTSGGGGNSGTGDGGGGRGGADPFLVPFSGALRVRSADGTLHMREVHLEKVDEADDAGMATTRAYLVFRRKRWSGKRESQRIPLEGLQVYADDDQTGSSFFIEFAPMSGRSAVDHVAGGHSDLSSTANQAFTLGAVQQSFLRGTEMGEAQQTVTFECETGSFAARRQWLQWLEVALKKPILYLSIARRNAEAQKPAEQGPHTGLLGDRVVW